MDAELFGFLDGNAALLSHLALCPVTVSLLTIWVSVISLVVSFPLMASILSALSTTPLFRRLVVLVSLVLFDPLHFLVDGCFLIRIPLKNGLFHL